MAREIIEIPLGAGEDSILVEVDDREPGFTRASIATKAMSGAAKTVEDGLATIRRTTDLVLGKLAESRVAPDAIEIEFGIRLHAAAGAVIASTEVEGHLQVKLTWNKARE